MGALVPYALPPAIDDFKRAPRILVLDDDPFMLGVQARMLQSMGYAVVESASDPRAALVKLQDDPFAFDIVICDLNMPEIDGIEFLRQLNAGPFRGSIILLSGEGARIMHTVQKLLGGGQLVILGALEKPAARAGLLVLLESWKPQGVPISKNTRPAITHAELASGHAARQWVLHYQPKVDLKTGALAGMEALVRWNHPLHGLVYPDMFIDIAEDSGLIDELTQWVLQAALRQLSLWRAQGLRIKMAINVSMDNLSAPDFGLRVGNAARDSGVFPHDVILEITESRLMSPTLVPLENLVRLRMKRFGLSIDDFGTGHSSLAQLRDVPFTELKVDRGFVKGALHNQIIRPILEGSIGIAKRMGMTSVAEGVETEEDWHLLREIDCDLAQGYFIGRPMPADEVEAWFDCWCVQHARMLRGTFYR